MHGPPVNLNHFRRFPIPTPVTRTSKTAARGGRHGGRSQLGQNFLIDRRIARRIVNAADLAPDDQVLEIGPGRGALTGLIAERCSRLVAVELDPELAAGLPSRLSPDRDVTVVNIDALELDPSRYFDGPYKLIANLPYYVATAIIRRYLTVQPKPRSMVVMVQREVAQNIAATPGRMSLISVMVQLHGSVRMVASVPPRAFRPRPRVTSAVIRIDPFGQPVVPIDDPDAFVEFAAAGFRAPRKQIRNSLRLGLGATLTESSAALAASDIDGERRPATLSLDEWARLYTVWVGRKRAECCR